MQELIITGLVTLGISVLLKYIKKEKIQTTVKPLCIVAMITLETLLLRFLPKKAEEAIEEGIFVTVFDTVEFCCKICKTKLLENNSKKKG